MPIGAVLGFKGFAKVTDMSSSARSCDASFQDAEGHKKSAKPTLHWTQIPLQNRLSSLIHTQTVALRHRGTPHPDLMRVLLHQCLPWNVNPVIHSLRIWSNGPNGPTQRRRIRWLLNHCGRCHRRFCRGNQRSTLLGDSANGFGRPRLSPFAACLQTWWLRDAPGMFRERFGWFLWSKVDLSHPSLFCSDLLGSQLSILMDRPCIPCFPSAV